MDKLDPETHGRTPDLIAENVEQLRRLFPEAFTEGRVDIEVLRELLGDFTEERAERYGLNWAGKSRARQLALAPSAATLRPAPDESLNWDTTHNVFIEGDNLEVLKLLQKSYHRRVKMIYIDPPYNTGKEFIYPDRFQDNLDTYLRLTGQVDGEGLKLSANTETQGRYHTNWLNMMYPRLKLARNLLRDDGVIFVSIDDHEVHNLRHLMDEVFGEENFLATIVWEKVHTRKNSAKTFSVSHDFIVCYAREWNRWDRHLLPREGAARDAYSNPDDDPRGPWKPDPISAHNQYRADYEIVKPNGVVLRRPEGRYWAFSKDSWDEKVASNAVLWGEGSSYPMIKRYLSDVQDGLVPVTLFRRAFAGDSARAKSEIDARLGTVGVFDYPKPTSLVSRLLQISTNSAESELILDFFAGSGTTGDAVMQLNAADGGNRRYILVQLPEPTESDDYATIADITKARLRAAAKAIAEDAKTDDTLPGLDDAPALDLGFRTFKLDSSNIRPWDADADSLEDDLVAAIDNIKHDRRQEDVLYELVLKLGLDLSTPAEERSIGGKRVYVLGAGALVVCLDERITLDTAEGISALRDELQPETMKVVFKDASFADDVVKTNAMQVLKRAGIDDVKSL